MRFAVLSLAALLLLGCQTSNNRAGLSGTEFPDSVTNESGSDQVSTTRTVAVPNHQSLIGTSPSELTALLGVPVFSRVDMKARLWRYRAERCVLDFFLYPDTSGAQDKISVTWLEARKPDGTAADSQNCLTTILKARTQTRTS